MNNLEHTDCRAGTVFRCKGSQGDYLAVYTGSWVPLGQHVKLKVIKLHSKQNHNSEQIPANEIIAAIDRGNIFSEGDPVRVPLHTGLVQEFTDEFVVISIRTHSRTKVRYPRLIALNAEYAHRAAEEMKT